MIKVRSKTLFVPAEEQSIGASGEADSTVREFHIDRVSGDGVDLANLLFKLNIRYAGVREIDRSDLEKVVTDNEIILRWLISSVTMSHAGTAFIQLDAFDNTGSCRWKSYPCAVYIEKSIDGTIPQNTLTELEQLEKKFSTVNAQEEERKTAEEKRVTAEEKREEAEGRRNTSLSNIVAEEEKIVALSNETKGYRDSVASDKASVEAVKANVQELKADTENIKTSTLSAVETAKTEINRDMATAKNEVNSTIAGAKAELNSTISTAKTDLGSMVSEGTKIKGEISTLKSEVNTVKEEAINAKTEAINAKNEAVTAKSGASTVKEEITAIKVEINASAEKAKQNADKAETSANTAKTAETNAEAFKTEAGKSAEKAKESETKTLEALAKAQEGGKGTLSYEVLKDEEIDDNKIIQALTLEGWGLPFPSNKLATTNGDKAIFSALKTYMKTNFKGLGKSTDILSTYNNNLRRFVRNGFEWPAEGILGSLRYSLAYGLYANIKVWDYIDIPTTIPGTENMRFYVMAIDMDESKNSIDFISFDYPERILMTEEELKSFGNANDEKILGLVDNKIKSDERLGELNESVKAGHISKIKRFDGGRKTQNKFHFWTIDVGEVLGIVSIIMPKVEGREMFFNTFESFELFKTRKYGRIMNKGKYLTCSYRPDFVTVFDENGIPRALSLKDAFGALPQGTSQEDVRKLRPIIPVCFRITSAE